jgi:cell division protein FtsZ
MQEINDGNNVIFEAAGEEANVIFGCVRKEEMNDYVSYTVIATGFDGAQQTYTSKTTKNQATKTRENFLISGGFDFTDPKDIDKDDLDVPTIIRVKSPKQTLNDKEEDVPKSGFNPDASRYGWSRDKAKKKEEDDSIEEDSSSFLRMIMD